MTAQPVTQYLTEAQLTEKAARLAVLQERIDEATQEADAIKAEIRDGVPAPDSYAAGGLTVVVSPNRRYSEAKALAALEGHPLRPVVVQTETVEKVNRKLLEGAAPDLYEQAFDEYGYRIAVK